MKEIECKIGIKIFFSASKIREDFMEDMRRIRLNAQIIRVPERDKEEIERRK